MDVLLFFQSIFYYMYPLVAVFGIRSSEFYLNLQDFATSDTGTGTDST